MQMNGWMIGCMVWSGVVGTAVLADAETGPESGPRERPDKMVVERVWTQAQELSPEERQARDAARKRRFEIMVLMQAYKIMPEAERAPLKAELLKRIEADLRLALTEQKRKLAETETALERLRQDIARREKNAPALAAQEMERLLRLPPPYQHRRDNMRTRKNQSNGNGEEQPAEMNEAGPPPPEE